MQQRSGRKCITTVQGLADDLDLKRILKAFKKNFRYSTILIFGTCRCCSAAACSDDVVLFSFIYPLHLLDLWSVYATFFVSTHLASFLVPFQALGVDLYRSTIYCNGVCPLLFVRELRPIFLAADKISSFPFVF